MTDNAIGVLKLTKKGGELRTTARSFSADAACVRVSAALIKEHRLPEGAMVSGPIKNGSGGSELASVETVGGLAPEAFQKRTPYKDLVAIDPCERFALADTGEMSMRIIDLIAPIGKGTRGLIVSPPKAGKTTILEQLAAAIHACDPKTRIIVLLLDERPEEVTQFRRTVKAEVLASSNDQSIAEHVELAELTLAHIRTELECGRDIVVLVDSLTRLSRAFNLQGKGKGRMMSGGVEAGALEIPRRFFGLARNIENGGSVTIVATALVDTGSRMDQLIFEEFKGTGNSEIVLDRSLAEARLFPAIDIPACGTRKEELLLDEQTCRGVGKLRRVLADRKPREALQSLLQLLGKFETNAEFLKSFS